jgi:hypothetical protein
VVGQGNWRLRRVYGVHNSLRITRPMNQLVTGCVAADWCAAHVPGFRNEHVRDELVVSGRSLLGGAWVQPACSRDHVRIGRSTSTSASMPKALPVDVSCHREREVRATLKDSRNFSLTLTRTLTWAGSPRTGAGCSTPGTLATFGAASARAASRPRDVTSVRCRRPARGASAASRASASICSCVGL